jgi:hypothetical protein
MKRKCRMKNKFDFLEGRKFCVVFVKVLCPETEKVQLRCLRGRASVDKGKVSVVAPSGNLFTVPATAQASILPSDGTAILKDAEYYCLVKVDDNIELVSDDSEGIVY